MHYHAEILIPTDESVEKQVAGIMAPFKENEDCSTGFWDWYQIGGRWKGEHVPGYNPNEDSEHIETCQLCNGTGDRPGWVWYDWKSTRHFVDSWAKDCNGCNGCSGKGQSTSWPTQWNPHPKDVIQVSQVSPELSCFTLIANGHVLHKKIWTGEEFIETDFDGSVGKALSELSITDGFLVTIDYHC